MNDMPSIRGRKGNGKARPGVVKLVFQVLGASKFEMADIGP